MKEVSHYLREGLAEIRKADSMVDELLGGRGEEIVSRLDAYVAEIELFNPVYSLVKAESRGELVIKHILDSLSPLGIILRLLGPAQDVRVADVGSGAGLPGIPLAVALPRVRFSLIERMGRRAGFLRNTAAALGLANVEIMETEMEQADRLYPAGFDMAVFRALSPLKPALLGKLFALIRDSGCLAAWKGRREVIDAELIQAGASALTETLPVTTPFLNEERHLLVIRKGTPSGNL
jgi:16S rRNA (guanine527-N7)-methyltransferase